jgi:hypothetical protein
MKVGKVTCLLVATTVLGLLPLACEAGGVGDPCIPEDEYFDTFNGYQKEEVTAESRSFQCETRVCLVHHFQGRVSCPYGQTEDEAKNDPQCMIPGTSQPVVVPVDPQITARRDIDAVYCSCRCRNIDGKTDDGARYCECPSGYDCERVYENVGLGKEQLTGYYCIKQGTKYDPSRIGTPCTRVSQNCEPAE